MSHSLPCIFTDCCFIVCKYCLHFKSFLIEHKQWWAIPCLKHKIWASILYANMSSNALNAFVRYLSMKEILREEDV